MDVDVVGDFNIGFNLVLDGLSLTMPQWSLVWVSLFTCMPPGICARRGLLSLLRLHQPVHRQHGSLVLADNLLLMYLGWEGVGLSPIC